MVRHLNLTRRVRDSEMGRESETGDNHEVRKNSEKQEWKDRERCDTRKVMKRLVINKARSEFKETEFQNLVSRLEGFPVKNPQDMRKEAILASKPSILKETERKIAEVKENVSEMKFNDKKLQRGENCHQACPETSKEK